jgi:hypothetical protein
MQMTITVAQMLVRIAGVLVLVLGLLVWAGDAPLTLVPVHMLLGVLMVLALWLLAAVASQVGVPIGMAAGAASIGLLTLILGLTQDRLLVGAAHWVIQVLHVLVGIAAVGSGEIIGGRVRRRRLSASTV